MLVRRVLGLEVGHGISQRGFQTLAICKGEVETGHVDLPSVLVADRLSLAVGVDAAIVNVRVPNAVVDASRACRSLCRRCCRSLRRRCRWCRRLGRICGCRWRRWSSNSEHELTIIRIAVIARTLCSRCSVLSGASVGNWPVRIGPSMVWDCRQLRPVAPASGSQCGSVESTA
jgi:hypothetical protein